jgi:hypothetical protein
MVRQVAAIALLALLLGAGAAAQDAALLTEQDVVQLHVRGTSVAELLRTIAQSSVEFDVSEEMLEELRIAGIPDEVVEAMVRRQAEMTPAAPPGTAVVTREAGARLLVKLNPDRKPGDPPATITALNQVDPKLAEALGIRSGEPTITDLAIALYCRTADHVPDHWRSKSPLGRDFNVSRHAILTFLPGARSEPAAQWRDRLSKMVKAQVWRESMTGLELLTLEVPDELVVELEPGVAHDLSLALAMQIGGRSYVAIVDERDGVIVEPGEEKTLTADLRSRKKDPLKATVGFREVESD